MIRVTRNSKFIYWLCLDLFVAGTTAFAQANNSEANGDNAGTKTSFTTAPADGLLYPPTYDECMKSGQPVITRSNIYHDGWIDLNKNGKKDIYEDSSQPVDKRIDDLLSQMTLEEKTAQLATLYGYKRVLPDYLPTTNWHNAFGTTAWPILTRI